MPELNKYLMLALNERASDIHMVSGIPLRLRIDGDLVEMALPPFESEQLKAIFFEIMTEIEREKFSSHRNFDKSYSIPEVGNFRINLFLTRRGVSAVIRTIPTKIPNLYDLGLPQSAERLGDLSKGLVLVTGPTGSGKSTTLASILNHINQKYPYHILTVEDPIEFVHESKRSLVNQREIGNHCNTFSDALKYALREDPDVILVGEMRDLETISLALTAAETGHLVFGTLHTRGAASSVDRIIDSFPSDQQAMVRVMLSQVLVAVISQALLKKADGKGRVAALEIMMVNHGISNLIREGKTFQITSMIQTGRKEGMILMDQHILELVEKKLVSLEEATAYLVNPDALQKLKTSSPSSFVGTTQVKATAEVKKTTAQGSLKPSSESVNIPPSEATINRAVDSPKPFSPSTLQKPRVSEMDPQKKADASVDHPNIPQHSPTTPPPVSSEVLGNLKKESPPMKPRVLEGPPAVPTHLSQKVPSPKAAIPPLLPETQPKDMSDEEKKISKIATSKQHPMPPASDNEVSLEENSNGEQSMELMEASLREMSSVSGSIDSDVETIIPEVKQKKTPLPPQVKQKVVSSPPPPVPQPKVSSQGTDELSNRELPDEIFDTRFIEKEESHSLHIPAMNVPPPVPRQAQIKDAQVKSPSPPQEAQTAPKPKFRPPPPPMKKTG